jgi:hypothetical protein
MDSYKKKYLKYKAKYLSSKDLLEQKGGDFSLETEDIYDNLCEELKVQASIEGKQLLDTWLANRGQNGINQILALFDSEGKKDVSATAFSDYYKWTMMPVIWFLHKFITEKTGQNTFRVTFGIDIRDEKMRKAINTNEELRNEIRQALLSLTRRKFDKNIFNFIGNQEGILRTKHGASLLTDECVNYICGSDEKLRSLAVDVLFSEEGRTKFVEDDEVHISFFKVATAKYNDTDEEGLWFIEARGPWPRVTWLETSMMQAVYEAYLRYNLKKNFSGNVYQRWLYGALLRCAKSVAFTRLVQKMAPSNTMTPALFTGRRTGGYIFLLLQNLFFAHHFNQAGIENPVKDNTFCLGTSSVDCYFELKTLGLPCLNPVGTHAHELSMVISVLFPYFDKNKYELPLTQIIGHELYRILSADPRSSSMFPMLPDTLGTAAFMKAANWVKTNKPDEPEKEIPFIDLINSARQDSGKLEDFLKLMKDWNYTKGMMASEIDNTEKLLKAKQLGYTTFGAGGFNGDSAKVWNPSLSSPSMAVKAVNVEYCIPADENQFYFDLGFPHISSTDKGDGTFHVIGYPIKIGDPENMAEPALAEGKLSLDKTLPAYLIEIIKRWASDRRVRAFSNLNNDDKKIKADSLKITDFTGVNLTPTQGFLSSIRG